MKKFLFLFFLLFIFSCKKDDGFIPFIPKFCQVPGLTQGVVISLEVDQYGSLAEKLKVKSLKGDTITYSYDDIQSMSVNNMVLMMNPGDSIVDCLKDPAIH
jgi:hypothetical protein